MEEDLNSKSILNLMSSGKQEQSKASTIKEYI